uniref:odorant receptor Or2-like n=1 Tax=Vespula vulgaris TaxID=7454 RepID=UPI00223B7DB3|nr:odorant receptor Or2-like [Vespula vulgaris]
MCTFGNMSTSTYWTVFVLQSIQLFNAVLIESGNDVFFFGISMQVCGQLDSLRILLGEFRQEKEEDRVREIREFVDKHAHLLGLARRIEDTFTNVLLVLLMTNGMHICLTGNGFATVAFVVILIQLFLYSYAGDFLSSLTQDIYHVIYNYPWYELSPNNVRNLVFIIMRAHKPFRLRAGRFYPMDIDSFKNILKASFSYFSVLRIVFEE